MLPVYVPAAAGFTQFGESFSRQKAVPVPLFVNCTAESPVWPPETRARSTPDNAVFQPAASVSKVEFLTKLTPSVAVPVLPESLPVTIWGPPTLAVHTFPLHDPS